MNAGDPETEAPNRSAETQTVGDAAMHIFTTLLTIMSIISMLVGVFPLLWGQVRVKWLVTGITYSMTLGMIAMVTRSMEEPPPETAAPPPSTPTEIDWGKTGIVLLVLIGLVAAVILASKAKSALATRRRTTAERARQRALALDPANVARTIVPDLTEQVDQALERIARLKSMKDRLTRPEDADALVMIDKRVPSVMGLYLKASEACTQQENEELARTALGSVVEIGLMAEDARQRIVQDLRSELDTESRYISSRSGWASGLRAD